MDVKNKQQLTNTKTILEINNPLSEGVSVLMEKKTLAIITPHKERKQKRNNVGIVQQHIKNERHAASSLS